MSKYTIDALKKDLSRLTQVGKTPMGFRPSSPAAEDKERKELKKRLQANGFDVELLSRPWITLEEEDE